MLLNGMRTSVSRTFGERGDSFNQLNNSCADDILLINLLAELSTTLAHTVDRRYSRSSSYLSN